MRNNFTKAFIALIAFLFSAGLAHSQELTDILQQAANIYGVDTSSANTLTGGFSAWGILGGIIFGSIGFIAFAYGKKNSSLWPMILGALLMIYPYFIRGTLLLYVVGIALTAGLYLLRS